MTEAGITNHNDYIFDNGLSMVAIQYKEEINKEAEAHIALGLLLRKERSKEKKKAVEEIFQSDLSVIEKGNDGSVW